jgi:hypothetical protein
MGFQIARRPDHADELVEAALGFGRHARHLVDDHSRQIEVGVLLLPDAIDGVGDGIDAA